MTRRNTVRPVLAALAVMLWAQPAVAQSGSAAPSVPATPPALRLGSPEFARLVQGKTVDIVTIDGEEVSGRVQSVSPNLLTIGGSAVMFDQIQRVQRPDRRVIYSGLIGIGAGLALGFATIEHPTREIGPVAVLLEGALGYGLGSFVGKILYESRKGRDVIYDRQRTATVSFAPILSRTRAGFSVSVAWVKRRR